jgi:hypothetical protein
MVDVYNPFSLINALKQSRVRPFKTDKRQVIGLGIELDENGKGILIGKRWIKGVSAPPT